MRLPYEHFDWVKPVERIPTVQHRVWRLRLWWNRYQDAGGSTLGEIVGFLCYVAFILAVFNLPEITQWLP